MTKRQIMIGGALLAFAAAIVAVIVAMSGGSAGSAQASVGDPHAPAAVSKDLLNAVDKVSLTASEAELVAKGRELFRSSALAKDGESCQSCHTDGGANAELGTTPHVRNDPSVNQSFQGPRDPPTLFNVGRTDPYFWIGDAATLEEVALRTITNHWKAEFQANKATDAAALTAYMKTIKPPTTDFDRGTMSAAALRGEALFQGKAACVACHGGPDFTDNRLHDTFVPQSPVLVGIGGVPNDDPGAQAPPPGQVCPHSATFALDPAKPLECAINTPTLRGIGLPRTAPYMHNGACRFMQGNTPTVGPCDTLAKVVSFYNTFSAVSPLLLTAQEQADLVEYLKAL